MSSHSADDLVDSEGDPAEGLLVVGAGVVLPSPPVGQVDSGAVPAPVLPRVARGPVGPPRQGVLVLGVEGGDRWMREERRSERRCGGGGERRSEGKGGRRGRVEEGVREGVKERVEGGDG